jgi:hypothetical protein
MSVQNFTVEQPYRAQGNILVTRAAQEDLEILLYHNRIIKYHSETDHAGVRTERLTLDECGKATLTTARAMNRGLDQLGFPGRVRLDNGHLVYSNDRGVKLPLLTPLTLDKAGNVYLFAYYMDAFKDIEVTVIEDEETEARQAVAV